MIKVGDKVAIIGEASFHGKDFNGQTGTIWQVDLLDNRATYNVEFEDACHWFPATSVKPAAQETPWIKNTTGVCPFKSNPRLLIDVKYRSGMVLLGVPAFESFRGPDTTSGFWQLDGMSCDIVAYRVVADSEGWVKNSGDYPADGDAELQIRFFGETEVYPSNRKDSWSWGIESYDSSEIEFWRFKQPEVAPVVASTLAQQVARLEADAAENEREMDEMRKEIAFLKGKLDAIRGLV